MNQESGLKNGDEVKYSLSINEGYTKYLDCKSKSKNGHHKVSWLKQAEPFVAFANLSVSFIGMSPNGSVLISTKNPQVSLSNFSCDKSDGLRNGDTVTISVKDENIEDIVNSCGKVPAEREKTYTVSDLPEYVESYDKLSEDFINSVKKDSKDIINAYIEKEYGKTKKAAYLKYSGYVMNHAKDCDSYWGDYNNLYIIYSATVSSTEDDFPTSTVHYPVQFSPFISDKDGISYSEASNVLGNSKLGDSFFDYTRGYTNAFTCYSEIIDSDAESFDFECGGDFRKSAGYKVVSSLSELTDAFKKRFKKLQRMQYKHIFIAAITMTQPCRIWHI